MQAHGDKQLGSVMYLPLAEKMTLKYIQEGKLEAEAGELHVVVGICLLINQNLHERIISNLGSSVLQRYIQGLQSNSFSLPILTAIFQVNLC